MDKLINGMMVVIGLIVLLTGIKMISTPYKEGLVETLEMKLLLK